MDDIEKAQLEQVEGIQFRQAEISILMIILLEAERDLEPSESKRDDWNRIQLSNAIKKLESKYNELSKVEREVKASRNEG